MQDTTLSREAPRPTDATGRVTTRLVFLLDAGAPEVSSSSHVLDDVDEVRFGRGERALAERQVIDGKRSLVLSFPDSRMSRDNGALARIGPDWWLVDQSSKNRAIVDGQVTARARIVDGTLFELGYSFFMLRQSQVVRVPAQLAGDVDASRLLDNGLDGMVTLEPAYACELDEVARLATTMVSILVLGETGTGKEVVARAIHALSRRAGSFVGINCGALSQELVGAELFGSRPGAFTGAHERKGLIRSADGGTLFLDEIGELPLAAQATLLRVLQERQVRPLGSDRDLTVDLRLVAATLRDLERAVADGAFRDDLHARLCGHVVTLWPLRERRADLGLLISTLLRRVGDRALRFDPAALRSLLQYDWPHNIRELEQALETASALADGDVIRFEHLPAKLRNPSRVPPPSLAELDPDDQVLRARLVELFEANRGSVASVAKALGKQRAQIYKWIDRLGIDLSAFRK